MNRGAGEPMNQILEFKVSAGDHGMGYLEVVFADEPIEYPVVGCTGETLEARARRKQVIDRTVLSLLEVPGTVAEMQALAEALNALLKVFTIAPMDEDKA